MLRLCLIMRLRRVGQAGFFTMRGLNQHPIEYFLHKLAGSIWRHPRWFLFPQLVLFAIAVFYTATTLRFKIDINDLVSSDVGYQRHWQELREEFHVQDDIITLVESPDHERNRQFVERLGARLEAETNLFTDVVFKRDLRVMGAKALMLLPEEKLEGVLNALRDYQPLVGKFSEVTNLVSLLTQVEVQWRASLGCSNNDLFAAVLPALTQIVEQGGDSVKRSGVPPSPGMTTLFAARDDTTAGGYLSLAGGRFYVVTCAAPNDAMQATAILRLRELVLATQRDVPGVNVGVTGEPVLGYEEMKQAQTDTLGASVVALVIVALTFIFCYGQIVRPLMATGALLVGIGFTLGFATLTVGHLNILTITFVPILIGMAIDFGVHLIARYEEELREGQEERVALDKALVATGTGILTSGVTTAVAFFAMLLTSFKGIREMGVIAGGGLLVCLIPMMTMLPAMLVLRGSRASDRAKPSRRKAWNLRRERFERHWLARPRIVLWMGGIVTFVAAVVSGWMFFDYNPLNLQSQNLSAVMFERRMIAQTSRSALSCQMTASSLEEALHLEKKIRRLGSVADVDSMAPLLVANQEGKLSLVRQVTEAASAIRFEVMDTNSVNIAALDQTLQDFGRAVVGAIQFMGDSGDPMLREKLSTLREAVGRWRGAIADAPAEQAGLQTTLYQKALFNDLDHTLDLLRRQHFQEPLGVQDLPAGMRSRFIGQTGKFLLQIYPRKNVWEHEAQKEFVRELRTVSPSVTGSPVRFYENTTRLRKNFQIAAAYACVAIAIMLLLHFRNVACVILALLPVGLGILWTFGVMALFKIPFNPANIISPTLLIGIGVANGIHILNRFIEEQHPSILGKSTGKAVLVSALTTCTGFGSLMLAQHAGIASLGLVMALGSGFCMVASLTVLPALLLVLDAAGLKLGHGWLETRKGQPSSSDVKP